MTDNEIIKALECCIKGNHCRSDCPYDSEDDSCIECTSKLAKDTLNLINRLKVNEEKNENIIRFADKTIEKQQAEIERLSELVIDSNAKLSESIHCFTRMETLYKIKRNELKVAKSKARKEFAERLKERIGCKELANGERKLVLIPIVVVEERIDNLLEEME